MMSLARPESVSITLMASIGACSHLDWTIAMHDDTDCTVAEYAREQKLSAQNCCLVLEFLFGTWYMFGPAL